MLNVAQELFDTSRDIRYVAVYTGGEPQLHQRQGLRTPSSSESDRYEELIVNPTLLTLTQQRGNIDCGGLEYVLIRYGHFFELVHPVAGGHISVGIEPDGDPFGVLRHAREAARRAGLLP